MRALRLLVAALLAAGCDVQVGEKGLSLDVFQAKATDEWTRTYTLPEGGALDITNINGEIEATAAPGRDVEVRARREVRARSETAAREGLDRVDMREEVSADRVAIEARVPAGGDGALSGRQLFVQYHVRVPAGLTVTLRTVQGGVRLERLTGRITATTTNGGIRGSGLAGTVTATAVNGGVHLDLVSVDGDVSASTTNGGVRLELPPETRATVEATCVNGGIDIDDRFTLQASESSRRRVVATLNGGGTRISASTVNGGVRLTMRESGPAD